MKKLLMTLILGISILLSNVNSESAAPSKIVGLTGECDLAFAGCNYIPLTPTTICDVGGGCPRLSAPSFTSSTRFIGTLSAGLSLCRTSNDGGGTWANCTTQPLSSGGMEQYAIAGDGSFLAIGAIGITCNIRRSVDNGATWSTVFTNGANIGCGGPIAGGSRLKCIANGSCVFGFDNTVTGLPGFLTSVDNGQIWTLTGAGVGQNGPLSLVFDGSIGLEGPTSTLRAMKFVGGWSQGTAGVAGCTTSGVMIYNGVSYSLCKLAGVNSDYRLYTGDGVLFKTITLPNGTTGASGILGYSLANNLLYIVAGVNTSPIAVGIWVSRDDGTSFTQIYTSSTATNNMTAGDIYSTNGCIYFSTGNSSQVFVKIC